MRKSFVFLAFAFALLCVSMVVAQTPAPQASPYQPLTGAGRINRYWHQSFLSPDLYLASLGSAVGAQLNHDPTEWGQGFAGYSRRSASMFGRFTIQTTIHEAGAAALGLDPRYERCFCAGFWRRSGHAVKWSFITRNNQGSIRPDIPVLAAAYGSGMLSMLWFPQRYDALTDGIRVGSQQVGFAIGINIVREFGPELKRIVHRRR